MKSTPRIWLACLSLGSVLMVSCTERTLVEPKPADLVGKYKPADLTEKYVHADSELALRSDGTCELKAFPYMDYDSRSSHADYYDNRGTWKVTKDQAVWDLVVTIAGEDFRFNLHNESPPYQISQEGEQVDDEVLFFDQVLYPAPPCQKPQIR